MNEHDLDLERQLRAWYRAEVDTIPMPEQLRRDVRAVPSRFARVGPRIGRTGLTLLAAAALVTLIGGAVLSGTRPAPSPAPSHLAVAPSADPFSAPPSSTIVPIDPTWRPAGTMASGRSVHTATLLPDGRILVVGGTSVDRGVLSAAEIWDPVTRSFSSAGNAISARIGHAATLLLDGRVFIVGGDADGGQTAETWDPATGTFSAAGTMTALRKGGLSATTLPDGRVLVIGAIECSYFVKTLPRCQEADRGSSEIWDPTTNAFSRGPKVHIDRDWHTATLLPDGRVLVVGGTGLASDTPESAEVWDPTSGGFAEVDEPLEYRADSHTATLMPDGRVLIVGGETMSLEDERSVGSLASAELWDPVTEAFEPAGSMAEIRSRHQAARLPDGRVLVTGGSAARFTDVIDDAYASTELWDPATRTFSAGPSMIHARRSFTLTVLEDGSVVVIGGWSRTEAAEIVTEVATAEIWGAPVIP
jgi:hypothetical protein